MQAVTKLWYYRNMTLIGKVTILNTLVSLLFVYKFQVIHKLPENIVEKIESCFNDFIWAGKKPKIPLHILQKQKDQGGLGLSNIREKHRALCINWVKIARNNPIVFNLANYFIHGLCTDDFIWNCNLSKEDVKYLKISNVFWHTVTQEWCKLTYHEPHDKESVLEQNIVLNSHIRIDKKPIVPKGILRFQIKHMVENGEPCMPAEPTLTEVNWLQLKAIWSAVPNKWKQLLKGENSENVKEQMLELTQTKKFVSLTYCELINSNYAIDSSAKKWAKILKEKFDYDRHQRSFVEIYRITNIVKLRSFQYRLLHNTVFCNNVLYHWKIKDSKICELCKTEPQNIEHLLWNCVIVRKIWTELENYFNDECNLTNVLTINFPNIVYNQIHPKKGHVTNFITLVVKQFIYRCKCLQMIPTFRQILEEIQLLYRIELHNAHKYQKLEKHLRKWSPILTQTRQ